MKVAIIIIIVIIFVIVGVIGISIFISNYTEKKYTNHGHKSGTQVGGEGKTRFFMAANERAGKVGEINTNINLLSLLKEDEYLLANLLIPLKSGYKAEIDAVLITRKGIFCVETKNWVGHIYGFDEDDVWIQKYDDKYKGNRQHPNPIKQNEAHCEILERKLLNKYYVENVVIFPFLQYPQELQSKLVFTIVQFKEYYDGLESDKISERDLIIIKNMLEPFKATDEQLKKHAEEVRNRYN